MQRFDAIVVGGGIAGSTTAAALARRGLDVLICEAGLPSSKRLAGELMHPPATDVFEDLGLLEPLLAAGAAEVRGFAVYHDGQSVGSTLEYTEVPGSRGASIALEHGVMTRTLLDEVSRREGVTLWKARVTEIEDVHADLVRAHVRKGDETVVVCAPLVVSAEGRSARLRMRAGIRVDRAAPFRMIGWQIPGARLPVPGHGHVFAGGRTTSLAYPTGPDEVRVMFELGIDDDLDDLDDLLAVLPQPFRDDVRRGMETQSRETAKVWGMCPQHVSAGRLAVVGDAGGCVHPLTATGIAFCTQDAARLAEEIGRGFRGGAGVPDALVRYEEGRRAPMRARVALGPALVEALTSQTPEMRLLRHGLFRYWKKSKGGRSRSLGLLSTQEARPSVMAREYASVCMHALTGVPKGVLESREIVPALLGLARHNASQLRDAVLS